MLESMQRRTIVAFHAHPDDEALLTGGTLARAAAAGHRVVLVFATRGELGEPVPGVLEPGEQLAMRRSAECYTSAAALGAKRVEFLGFTDSGMMGEPSNEAPFCFWQADVEYAARTLAVLLDQEEPDVLTIYDDNGVYGHPDHIQVHRVGKRAGELSAVPVVAQGREGDIPPNMGKPESEITHRVEAVDFVGQKRESMRAHASQMAPDHFLLALPDAMFALGMGTEFYIVDPLPSPAATPELFEELFTPLR